MPAPSATTFAPTPSADSGFWDQFLTSAGFAGAMAVVAASIAAVVALRQFRGTQRQNEITRWWDTLTWVYDRSIVEKGTKAPLPQNVAVRMLRSLSDSLPKNSKDLLRGNTIFAILDMFDPTELRDELRKDLKHAGYGPDTDIRSRRYTTSFRQVRLIVGFVGIWLPLLLIFYETTLGGGVHVRGSLSGYYHSSMQDVLVAGLSIIGILLAIYKGAESLTWEFWLSLAAGIAAFGLIFFPVSRPGLPMDAPRCGTVPTPRGCSVIEQALGETPTAAIHAVFAVVFVLCLAAMSFLFASRDRKFRPVTALSQLLCGATMLLAFGWAVVGGLLEITVWGLPPLYLAEVASFWAFGVSWLMAGFYLTAPHAPVRPMQVTRGVPVADEP
jgi:hypothetical protein